MSSIDTTWPIIVMVVFGIAHITLLLYLRITSKHPALYSQLVLSKWIVFLMLAAGLIIAAIATENIATEGSDAYVLFLSVQISTSLALLGVSWFYQVGLTLLFLPVKMVCNCFRFKQ